MSVDRNAYKTCLGYCCPLSQVVSGINNITEFKRPASEILTLGLMDKIRLSIICLLGHVKYYQNIKVQILPPGTKGDGARVQVTLDLIRTYEDLQNGVLTFQNDGKEGLYFHIWYNRYRALLKYIHSTLFENPGLRQIVQSQPPNPLTSKQCIIIIDHILLTSYRIIHVEFPQSSSRIFMLELSLLDFDTKKAMLRFNVITKSYEATTLRAVLV